jgi:hypothetical protein
MAASAAATTLVMGRNNCALVRSSTGWASRCAVARRFLQRHGLTPLGAYPCVGRPISGPRRCVSVLAATQSDDRQEGNAHTHG